LEKFAVMNTDEDRVVARFNARAGSALLTFGLTALVLCVAANADRLPHPMQDIWARGPGFWIGLTIASFLGGLFVLWTSAHSETEWRPDPPNQRFEMAVLYTRKDCPLCDEAKELLTHYRRWLPPVREIDIDIHPDFRDAFCNCVPVLEIDDEIRFRGKVSEVLLRRLLQGSFPTQDVARSN
jgi:glutaredoxin